MKKKSMLVLVSILFFLFLSSCEVTVVDNSVPDCEAYGYGYVTITNDSQSPFDIYINGRQDFVLRGDATQKIEVDEGYNFFEAEQISGYILWPTKLEKEIYVRACSDYIFVVNDRD